MKNGKGQYMISPSPDHIPPTKATSPNNATLDRIGLVLETHEPAADVYWIATECLAWACGFLGFIIILIIFQMEIDRKDPPKSDSPPSHDLELVPVGVENAPKITSRSETPVTVPVPRSVRINDREDSGNGMLDPPPRYSYFATGR